MNKKLLSFICIAVMCCSACTEKKPVRKDIIVPPIKQEKPKGPQKMTQTRQEREVEWLGNTYKVSIFRQVDTSLPIVKDENSQEYYDNTIALRIQRADGSDFINRTFKKNDFTSHITDNKFAQDGALLGIVFDKDRSDNDPSHLYFATSVGSPDFRSDEFIPLILIIDRNGNMTIRLDDTMDTENDHAGKNGITGDEEA